ncbi:hypothetical protein JXA84_07585 [candidate division WOR-3 bacterium]|nr:hypothetical protein [candidate division WOR-3 bacterium]
MIAHVAVTVSSKEYAEEFFKTVLQCKYMYSYGLDALTSRSLFGIEMPAHVYIYMSGEDWIEVFVLKGYKKNQTSFDHICFRMDDIPGIVARGQKQGYTFIRHKKSDKTVLFIQDKDGNLYELKKKTTDLKTL